MSTRVGIRELQQHASRVIAQVKTGEIVEVTERGHLVAVLSPPSTEAAVRDKLIASRTLTPGKGGLRNWEPLPPRPDMPPLSQILLQMRDESER